MTAQGEKHPIARILAENGIDGISIIDDEFDPPVIENYLEDDIASFLDDINNSDCIAELEALGIKTENKTGIAREGFNNSILEILWKNKEILKILKDPCDKYFFKDKKRSEILSYLEKVQSITGLTVNLYGTQEDTEQILDQVIFIDYYLGPSDISGVDLASKTHPSVIHSIKVISEIIEHRGDKKPVIILMSSLLDEVREDLIAHFIEATGVIGGLFHFISKREFSEDKFLLMLASIAKSQTTALAFQCLLKEVKEALDKTHDKFLADVRKLKLSDYAFIQKLSLQSDGHPLGDYVLQLFGDYLGTLIQNLENMKIQRKVIDQIVFDSLPFHQSEPSLGLVDMYKMTLFGPLDEADISSHPRTPLGAEKKPYLHIGDLFVCTQNEKVVYMVINAQCDLAYAPDGKRSFGANNSVLFIRGNLEPLNELIHSDRKSIPRTEFFEYKGNKYRIMWDVKSVETCKYDDVFKYLRDNSLATINRLRLPYALEIQRAFAADLTRVGMPVAPPMLLEAKATLYCKGENNSAELLLESSKNEAIVFLTADGEHYSLTSTLIAKLLSEIRKKILALQSDADRLKKEAEDKAGGEKEKLIIQVSRKNLKATEMVDALSSFESFLAIRGPFKIDNIKGEAIIPNVLRIGRNMEVSGITGKEYLLLNIVNL